MIHKTDEEWLAEFEEQQRLGDEFCKFIVDPKIRELKLAENSMHAFNSMLLLKMAGAVRSQQ